LHHASVARTPTLEGLKQNLEGVELKLSRADSHVGKLKLSLEEALHPDLYTFEVRFDAASGPRHWAQMGTIRCPRPPATAPKGTGAKSNTLI
jgi:hypothetical protein